MAGHARDVAIAAQLLIEGESLAEPNQFGANGGRPNEPSDAAVDGEQTHLARKGR